MITKSRLKTYFLPFITLLVLGPLACNFSSARPTLYPIATQAAGTVAAELTRAAGETTSSVGETETPEATTETEPSDTPTPSPSPTIACTDKARFVKDVTIPDNTRMDPGEDFEKIWRLENVGTCSWTTDYSVVFDSGNIMGGSPSFTLDSEIPADATMDLPIQFTAPLTNGTHRGNWMLRNANGLLFGLGDEADSPFWVQIVVGPTPTPQPEIVYSFVDNYCSASWISGAGVLPCPGTDSDIAGFVLKRDTPKLETGVTENEVALQTHPQWINNGIISGRFPAFNVVDGDHFKTVIGCLNKSGGSACDIKFQLTYHADGGPLQLLGQWEESYDGTIRRIDIDLADKGLAGKSVEFSLVVIANGASTQDWAFWLLPRIIGPPR